MKKLNLFIVSLVFAAFAFAQEGATNSNANAACPSCKQAPCTCAKCPCPKAKTCDKAKSCDKAKTCDKTKKSCPMKKSNGTRKGIQRDAQ